jgi:hypothetical protein
MLVALLPRTQTVSKRLGTTLLRVRQSLSIFTYFFVTTIYIVYQSGKLSGVVSERDYILKIALLGKTVSN